jgi:UDP-2,4-diacetamido-2,4,6-trideoxy-beta-L-altropyranose hydrolase
MRCLTLAEKLQERGARIHFVCRELEGHLGSLIQKKGFSVDFLVAPESKRDDLGWNAHASWLEVPWSQDAEETAVALRNFGYVDWLIVDHYALDAKWEKDLRRAAGNIMIIDDLADRRHDCDLLLDQNLYKDMEDRYSGLLPTGCEQLLGPRFALLRPEFADARRLLRERDGVIRKILVFYGGVDVSNETEKALKAIRQLKQEGVHFDVIVGQSNPQRDYIEMLCSQMANVTFHCQTSHMAKMMAEADLALGSGGTVTWERCSLGLPAIVTTVALNQEELTAVCAEEGLLFWIGRATETSATDIQRALEFFFRTPHSLKAIGSRALEYVDSMGAQRIVGRLFPPVVRLRKATMEDCNSLYQWRNAEETRRFIFDPAPILLEEHRKWFVASLENHNRVLLIGESNGVPVGVLRYDISGSNALISIYLVPGTQGQGIGTQLIRSGSRWLKENIPQILTIEAEVMSLNVPSIKAFINAGYTKHHMTFKEVLH